MKRILVVAICIVIQLVFYFIALVGFVEQYTLLRILLSIVSVVTVLEIVTVNKNLTNKVPWIVLIALFPVFGSLLYITLGHNLYNSKILRAIKKSIPKSQKYLKQDRDVLEEIKDKDKFIYGQVKYLADFAKYPIYRANEIKYFPLGEDAYKVMEDARKAYNKKVNDFIKDYGSYHYSITKKLDDDEYRDPLNLLDIFFKPFIW